MPLAESCTLCWHDVCTACFLALVSCTVRHSNDGMVLPDVLIEVHTITAEHVA